MEKNIETTIVDYIGHCETLVLSITVALRDNGDPKPQNPKPYHTLSPAP